MIGCEECNTILRSSNPAVPFCSRCTACAHNEFWKINAELRKGITGIISKQAREADLRDTSPLYKNFVESIRTMQHAVHENAVAHGWWDSPREDGTILMLVVSELAEMLEAMRDGGGESKKIPGFSCEEEELADAVIRIFDFAGRKNYRLGAAILAKHEFNKTRPHKHDGKAF